MSVILSDDGRIREHVAALVEKVAPERRQIVREQIRRDGRFPIKELLRGHDARWTQLVSACRQGAAVVGRELRLDAAEVCVVFNARGVPTRVPLDDALALVETSPTPFVISCEPNDDALFDPGGFAFYDAGIPDPTQFMVGFDGLRTHLGLDWIETFWTLARRRATLLRVTGVFFVPRGEADESIYEDWPWELWLEFEGTPVIRLRGRGDGQSFHVQFDREVPSAPVGNVKTLDLSSRPPFVAVAQTPLQAVAAVSWAGDDASPEGSPVGVRLGFVQGEVWMINIGDELEVYGSRPAYLDEAAYRDILEQELPL